MADPDDFAEQAPLRRLLYIDDDELALKSLTVLLQTLGYDVDPIDDAKKGLEKFQEQAYDLVITDMNMPGMTGLDLTKELKRRQPDVPVIVISGSPPVAALDESRDTQPDCVLVKPLVALSVSVLSVSSSSS